MWEFTVVHTVTAHKTKRVRIPDAKPGSVFDYSFHPDGIFLLSPVAKKELSAGHVRFVTKDGFTIGITDRTFSMEQIKEGFVELP